MGKFHIGETCEVCGTKVMKIMWGMPTEDGLRAAEREGRYIGGCCMDESVSRCECGASSYDRDGRLVDGYGDDAPIDDLAAARSRSSHPSSGRRDAGTVR